MTLIEPKVFKNDGKQRSGRGFSREELNRAGSSMKRALKLGLRIDAKRKTAYDENVEALKAFIQEKRIVESPVASKEWEMDSEPASKAKKSTEKAKRQRGKSKS